MTITISGVSGEGRACAANIIRYAFAEHRIPVLMGSIPLIEREVAAGVMPERVQICIVDAEEISRA